MKEELYSKLAGVTLLTSVGDPGWLRLFLMGTNFVMP